MKKSKEKKFLAIGGPKDKEFITHETARDLGYFGFNRSQYSPARSYASYDWKVSFGARGWFSDIQMIYVWRDCIPHTYKPIEDHELAQIFEYEHNNPYNEDED